MASQGRDYAVLESNKYRSRAQKEGDKQGKVNELLDVLNTSGDEEVSSKDEGKISETDLKEILSKDLKDLTSKELNILLEHKFSEGDDKWLLEHFDILGRKNQDKLIKGMLAVKWGKRAYEILELLLDNFDKLEKRKDLQDMIINKMLKFDNGQVHGDFDTIFYYFNKIKGRPDLQEKCVDEAIKRNRIEDMLSQVDGISGSGSEPYIAENVVEQESYNYEIEKAFIQYLIYDKGIPEHQAYFIVIHFLLKKDKELVDGLKGYIQYCKDIDLIKYNVDLSKIRLEKKIRHFLEMKGDIRLDKNMAIELLKNLEETGNPKSFKPLFGDEIENRILDYVIKNTNKYEVGHEEDFIRAFVRVERGGTFLVERIRKKEFDVDRRLLLKVLKESPANVRLIAENVDLFSLNEREEEELIWDLVKMLNRLEKIIYLRSHHPVWHNIDKFSIDRDSVARILINSRSFRHIEDDIDKLEGLTPETKELLKDALKNAVENYVLKKYPQIFGSVDTEEMRESA